MQNFDIIKISKIVDWFNVMTYDLHGTWYEKHDKNLGLPKLTNIRDSTDRFIGPVVNAHTNLTEIDSEEYHLFFEFTLLIITVTMDLFWRNQVKNP
jgi:chitinase